MKIIYHLIGEFLVMINLLFVLLDFLPFHHLKLLHFKSNSFSISTIYLFSIRLSSLISFIFEARFDKREVSFDVSMFEISFRYFHYFFTNDFKGVQWYQSSRGEGSMFFIFTFLFIFCLFLSYFYLLFT